MPASARRPFRFTHRWAVPRPAAEVAALLADPLGYPTWWPSVSRARRIDGAGHDGDPRVAVLLRGLIPVRLVMARELDDRERGRLVARLDGDLRGTVRVTVHDDDGPAGGTGGCTVAWEQEVVLGAGRLRAAARLPGARAAMRLSHALSLIHI